MQAKRLCACGRNTCWLEIEGRTDDILQFESSAQIASDKLELRLTAENTEEAFGSAKHDLLTFLESKGLSDVEITLSDMSPQADKISGKFKHIYRGVL